MNEKSAQLEPQVGMSAASLSIAAQKADVLATGLEELAKVVGDGSLGLTENASKLKMRAASLRADRFRIVVVGDFSRGKSTLLNAVLGTDLLPQKAIPSTAIITVIEYADQPSVRLHFTASDTRDQTLSLAEFRSRLVLSEEDISDGVVTTDRFSKIDHAVVSYPVDLCRHRVELIDSPGLQDDPARTARTVQYLRRADAVIMVLDATALLTEEELHFLNTVLMPEGLKNIFFIINKWNLIQQSAVRPADADRDYVDLEARIQARLAPFCQAGGRDLSAQRIFRVDALGALRARMSGTAAVTVLASTGLPAFEENLQLFLVNERGRAKIDIVLGTLRSVTEEVNRFISLQLAAAAKSVGEIESELKSLQPKLDRLRGIRQHIAGFLDMQSANLQDRLVISLEGNIDRMGKNLQQDVDKFDLSEVMSGIMVWKAITDWARDDENKFAAKLQRCIEPQLRRLLEQYFAAWRQSAVKNEIQAVTIDVDKHLHEEAAEYQRVMREIEHQLGVQVGTLDADSQVRIWMDPAESESGDFKLSGMGPIGDMSWLVGSIAVDFTVDMLAHMTFLWIPIVGAIISVLRLAWREATLRSKIKEEIPKKALEGLKAVSQAKATAIRAQVRESFDKLKTRIVGSIDGEIASVEASLQSIADRKRDREHTMEDETKRLTESSQQIDHIMQGIRAAAL